VKCCRRSLPPTAVPRLPFPPHQCRWLATTVSGERRADVQPPAASSVTAALALKSRQRTRTRDLGRSTMPIPHSPKQNHLLAALPTAEFDALAAHLELVPMRLGDMLYEPGRQLSHAYFPTTSIVSLHYVMASGASAESAGVGQRGRRRYCVVHGREHDAKLGGGADRRSRLSDRGARAEAGIRPRRPAAGLLLRYRRP
jgi:hypothetical protein